MKNITDDLITLHAIRRIAEVFCMDFLSVRMEMSFDKDFDGSEASDFQWNEFDRIDHDIRDVANREVLRDLSSGALTINTVGDYCSHMVRCYKINAKEVVSVLGLE